MTALFKKLGESFFLEFAIVLQHDINRSKFDMSGRSGKQLSLAARVVSWKMATAKLTFCLLSLGCKALNVSFRALRNLAFRAWSLLYTLCKSDQAIYPSLEETEIFEISNVKAGNTSLFLFSKLLWIFFNKWTESKKQKYVGGGIRKSYTIRFVPLIFIR